MNKRKRTNLQRTISGLLFLLVTTTYLSAQTDGQLMQRLFQCKDLLGKSDYKEAESILSKDSALMLASSNDTIRLLYNECTAEILFFDKEDYAACIPVMISLIPIYERLGIKSQNYLDAFTVTAYCYNLLGDKDSAMKYYRKALIKSVTVTTGVHPEQLQQTRDNIYRNLGNIYAERGDSILARQCYANIPDSYQDADYKFDVDSYDYDKWCGGQWAAINNLVAEKRYDEAADAYVPFISALKQRRGPQDESYRLAVNSWGILLSRYLNNYEDALPLFGELIDLSATCRKDENIASAYLNILPCYARFDSYDKIDSLISEAKSYLSELNDDNYPESIIYRFAGNGAYWNGDYVKAIPYYEQYLCSEKPREQGFNYEEITIQLAVCHILSGTPGNAVALLEPMTKKDYIPSISENPQIVALLYHNLGRAYMLGNQYKKALSCLRKSAEVQSKGFGNVMEKTRKYITECMDK